jgi:Fibronectin type III domain/Divergent InlB B-repeat domain
VRRDETPPCFSDRTAPFFRYRRVALYWKFASATAPLLGGAVSFCDAGQSVTLAWDRNAEQDIASYKLYYGTQSGRPSQSLGVGNVTTATITNLNDGTTYFFAIAAVNTVGLEGPLSNEVSYTTPNPAAHVLTVNSGSGNGSYVAGTIVTVSANAPPAGKEFDRWLDDWVILSNPWMATTTATMPYQDVTITPSYSDLPAGRLTTLNALLHAISHLQVWRNH